MGSPVPSFVLRQDARHLADIELLRQQPPRTIITSPPYLDTQDYGVSGQIGFGQDRQQYFDDLKDVFKQCWYGSTPDATMWLVVGAVRRSGRLVQLPAILTALASEVGWIPREQITWAKGKSLPWARPGEFRDITEQAILFSKADSFAFNLEDLLSPDPKSVWWKRYPERYSPRGRRPTNLWDIPIPTQGSWKEGHSHLCPFPHELTFRMVSLTSAPGDVVLDPFAGIGSVPAMAGAMGRTGYGIEISQRYVDRFPETLRQSTKWFAGREAELRSEKRRRLLFYNTIRELRLLKFGSILAQQLTRRGYSVNRVHVVLSRKRPDKQYKVVTGRFDIHVPSPMKHREILDILHAVSGTRPLSKFGVQPSFRIVGKQDSERARYWYPQRKFWLAPMESMPEDNPPYLTSGFRPLIEKIQETVE